jgi:hypothetical protein
MAKAAKVVNNQTNIPLAEDAVFTNASVQTLDGLITRRKRWEATDYKKANDGLYALLADCLALFNDKFVGAAEDSKKALRIELTHKLKADGIKVQQTTPTLTMFVRYVFGSDRKRAHGYAYVLKAAISHGVSAKELPDYILREGGIEEVKRKMVVKEETLAKRAVLESAKVAVKSAVESAAVAPLAQIALAGVTGEFAVLLARPTPDGMVNIVGILSKAKDSLVEALVAQMAKHKVDDDAVTAALDKETTDLLAGSANAANSDALAKQA